MHRIESSERYDQGARSVSMNENEMVQNKKNDVGKGPNVET